MSLKEQIINAIHGAMLRERSEPARGMDAAADAIITLMAGRVEPDGLLERLNAAIHDSVYYDPDGSAWTSMSVDDVSAVRFVLLARLALSEQLATVKAERDAAIRERDQARSTLDTLAHTPPEVHAAKWAPIGTRVRKTKGSSWQGRIVGFYSTDLTPVGYCVESEREPGSVQIYPETALELVGNAHD
jgi:hypothetical protein